MTPGLPREAGWLERQFESAANDYAELPAWMKRNRGANPMTLDELLATSPLPWTSLKGIAFDCNGTIVPTSWGIVPNDMNALLVEAINRIRELQAEREYLTKDQEFANKRYHTLMAEAMATERERDSLKAKVEELESERRKFDTSVRVYDQRRFEAACAFGASHYARGMFSADPDAIAAFAVKYADALLAELSKPSDAKREEG